MVVENLKNIWIAVDILRITCVRTLNNDVVGTGINDAFGTKNNDVVVEAMAEDTQMVKNNCSCMFAMTVWYTWPA